MYSITPTNNSFKCEGNESKFWLYTGVITVSALGLFLASRIPYFQQKGKEWYAAFKQRMISWKIQDSAAEWEAHLSAFKQANSAESDPLTKSRVYQRIRQTTEFSVYPLAGALHEIGTQYLAKKPLLELGSNVLDANGNSYLAQLLPAEYSNELTYSDYSKEVVDREKHKTPRRYIQVDATKMNHPTHHIVAMNVIDTIARQALKDVVASAHRSLQKNGCFVILSTLPFDSYPFALKYSTEDRLIIPFLEGTDWKIKTVSSAKLIASAPRLEPLIRSLMELSPKKRFDFLMHDFIRGSQLGWILQNVCGAGDYQTVDHKHSYLSDLMEAFSAHGGFEVVKNEYIEKSVTVPGGGPTNSLNLDLRLPHFVFSEQRRGISPDRLQLNAVMHAFIARKKALN